MQTLDAIKTRRSIRKYKAEQITAPSLFLLSSILSILQFLHYLLVAYQFPIPYRVAVNPSLSLVEFATPFVDVIDFVDFVLSPS